MPSGNSAVAPSTMSPDDLVAGNECILSRRQFAFHDVQIGAANAARAHPKQDLTRCRAEASESLRCEEAVSRL